MEVKFFGGITAALILMLSIECALAWLGGDQSPRTRWGCELFETHRAYELGQPAEWSRKNDDVCKATCRKSAVYPNWKSGNWALFEDEGLVCCCAVRDWFIYQNRNYAPTKPFIDDQYAKRLGVNVESAPYGL